MTKPIAKIRLHKNAHIGSNKNECRIPKGVIHVQVSFNNTIVTDVESGSTRTEIKHWVKLFFGVKVLAMNSHRLLGKGRRWDIQCITDV